LTILLQWFLQGHQFPAEAAVSRRKEMHVLYAINNRTISEEVK
jgi:hypothetical protein